MKDKKAMTTYIEDGFNLSGYVAAAPISPSGEKLWEAVEFEYRPATRAEQVRLDSQVRVASNTMYSDPESGVKIDKLGMDFVAAHLKSWNIVDSNKIPIPLSAASFQRVHDAVYQKILMVIRGMETSDKRPEAEKPDPTDEQQLGN